MATMMLFVPLLLLVACLSDVFHNAVFAENTIKCNETMFLKTDSALDLSIDLPPSQTDPLDCWLQLEAPLNYLVSVQGVDSGQETGDTTCSSWASFLDGGLGTTITDKVCNFNHVYRETTGNTMLIWYHAETPASALGMRVRVQALKCPSTCEDRINLDRNSVDVEPVLRTGDDCRRDSCFWKLCTPVENTRVELHAKAYRQGDISKCDYSKVVVYNRVLEEGEGQAGPTCETAITSAGQCMFLEYKLGGFPSSRFLALVTSVPLYGVDDASNAWLMGTVIPIVAILCLLLLVATGWILRMREVRNISTQTNRRAQRQNQASTNPISSVSEGVADLPPSYSSVCMELEERPPPYPAEQYELHGSTPSPEVSPLPVIRRPLSILPPPPPDSPPFDPSPPSPPPSPSSSRDIRIGGSVDTDRS